MGPPGPPMTASVCRLAEIGRSSTIRRRSSFGGAFELNRHNSGMSASLGPADSSLWVATVLILDADCHRTSSHRHLIGVKSTSLGSRTLISTG